MLAGTKRQVGAVARLSHLLLPRLSAHDASVACSRGIPAGPVARSCVVALPVVLVHRGDLGHERIIRVGVGQQRADGEKHLGDGERRRPLILEDVQANGAICIDVRMVNFRSERHLRWLEWVVGREVNVEEEDTTGVG